MEPAAGSAVPDERRLIAPTSPGAAEGYWQHGHRSARADTGDRRPDRPLATARRDALPFKSPFGSSAAVLLQAGRARLAAALETERDRGTAFVLVPVMLGCGALTYFSLAKEPSALVLVAACAFAAGAVAIAGGRPLLRPAMIAALLVLIGMLLAKWETQRAATLMLGEPVSTVVTGRVMSIEQQAGGRTRLTLEVLGTERPRLRHLPERVRLSTRKIPDGLAVGDAVTGPARLFPPSGPLRPGGYDFSFESYFDGIGASGFFLGSPRMSQAAPPAPFFGRFEAAVENARIALSTRIRERIGGTEGEIAAALIAGVRAGIPDEANEALRRTGLAHILSISGLHMALVAATVMGTLRAAFSLFPGFASRRPVKKYAASAALLAIAVYLFISGSAVAAERSFLMLAVMLAALLFDRAAITMRNLAIAAIAVLVVSPHEIVGPSFQMSFAATAALVGGYAWWAERRRSRARAGEDAGASRLVRAGRTFLRYAVGLAATSLIAGAATTIYGAWHFQRVSPLSLAANLSAMPVVSILIMPPAVMAMVAMPFGLDGPFLDIMGRGIAALVAIARRFSEWTPVDAVGTVPVSAVALASVALLLATLATTWLRGLALPFAAAALILLPAHRLPEALVAEDGRLLAVPLGDGRLAVNRSRPNRFAVDDWMRVTRSGVAAAPRALSIKDIQVPPRDEAHVAAEIFACTQGQCLARSRTGAEIARVDDAKLAADLCGRVQVIVLADAVSADPCAPGDATVITQRQLALRGSAALTVTRDGGSWRTEVIHAVPLPLRPWHDHRRFSRAARGLPPYERSRQAALPERGQAVPPDASAAKNPPDDDADRQVAVSIDGSGRRADPGP